TRPPSHRHCSERPRSRGCAAGGTGTSGATTPPPCSSNSRSKVVHASRGTLNAMRKPRRTSARSSASTSGGAAAAPISSLKPTRIPCARIAPANLARCSVTPLMRESVGGARDELADHLVAGFAQVVIVLEQAAHGDAHDLAVEPILVQTHQGLRPIDRFRHTGELVQIALAKLLHEARDGSGEALVQVGHPVEENANLLVQARVLDVKVEAAPAQGITDVAGAVRREHDVRHVLGLDRSQLWNGHLE